MGADLYIMSIHEKQYNAFAPRFLEALKRRDAAFRIEEKEKHQREVDKCYKKMFTPEGYFRDSYNSTSLFYRLGLSWWACAEIDDAGFISVENAKKLLARVKAIDLKPLTDAEWEADFKTSADSRESWDAYFAKKKKAFESFLRRAIKLGEPIKASV